MHKTLIEYNVFIEYSDSIQNISDSRVKIQNLINSEKIFALVLFLSKDFDAGLNQARKSFYQWLMSLPVITICACFEPSPSNIETLMMSDMQIVGNNVDNDFDTSDFSYDLKDRYTKLFGSWKTQNKFPFIHLQAKDEDEFSGALIVYLKEMLSNKSAGQLKAVVQYLNIIRNSSTYDRKNLLYEESVQFCGLIAGK